MSSDEIKSKLATLPEPEFLNNDWPDYTALGFGDEDVEGLLDIAADFYLSFEQSEEESAASIHAWRSLALRGDLALLPEFISLLIETDDIGDEWFAEDFPRLVASIGMPALPDLLQALDQYPEYECIAIAVMDALHQLSKDPAEVEIIKGTLTRLLSDDDLSREGKGYAVASLIRLHGRDRIAEIKEAFERNRVDLTVLGDLEEVEIELGLRTKRSSPQPDFEELEIKMAIKERREIMGDFPEDSSAETQMQYLLMLYQQPQSINRVDTLNGFLLSACLCRIPEAKVARHVWDLSGGDQDLAPPFENKREADAWSESFKVLYLFVRESLRDGCYLPSFDVWPDAEDSMDPETPYFSPWVEGFMRGEMIFNVNPTEEEAGELARLVEVVFEEEGQGRRLLEDAEDNPIFRFLDYIIRRAAEDRFLDTPAPGTPKGKTKLDRNSPCPCGSGLKYKKCCLN